jgi:hypothetical protein
MNRAKYIRGKRSIRKYPESIEIGDEVRGNKKAEALLEESQRTSYRLIVYFIRGKIGVVTGFDVSPEGGPANARVRWDTGLDSSVPLGLLEKT